eukprot:COSAG01_NODE_73904_length_233_cov_13.305970_1_plen_20_part_10
MHVGKHVPPDGRFAEQSPFA